MGNPINIESSGILTGNAELYRYIGQLFPFAFALDQNMEIVWSGKSFHKIFAGDTHFFKTKCRIKRPLHNKKEFAQITQFLDLLFILEIDYQNSLLNLKGQFVYYSELGHLVFCGSPMISKEEDIEQYGFNIGDFSVNDSALDTLSMISVHKLSTEDLNRMYRDAEKKTIEISKQRIFYEKILNNIPADIAIFDKDQNYIFLNKHAVRNPDIRKWLIGKNDFDYYKLKGHEDTTFAENRRELFRAACLTGELQEWTEIQDRNGSRIHTLRRFLPYLENGEVSLVIGYGIDITSIAEMEDKLRTQNKMMASILETISDGFLSMDNKMVVNYWNKKAADITMTDSHFIIGRHLSEAIDTKDGDLLLDIFRTSLKDQQNKSFEFFYTPRQEWFEVNCYPSESGLSVFFRSIKERKLLEIQKQKEYLLAVAINNFSKNILQCYDEEEIVWIAMENIMQFLNLEDCVYYKWDSATGMLIQQAAIDNKLILPRKLLNPILLKPGEGIVGAAAASKTAQLVPDTTADPRYILDDKSRASELAVPVLLGDMLIGVIDSENSLPDFFNDYHVSTFQRIADIIALKISEIRAHQQALQEKEVSLKTQEFMNKKITEKSQELERSNKELEYFAYTVSHDLQEPLRMITTFLGKLSDRPGITMDDKSKQYLDFSVDGARRMHQNIMDLLEYSRASSLDRSKSVIDMPEMTNRVSAALRRMVRETGANITYDGTQKILSHPTPLQHILQNLLDNSLKYRQPGVTPQIRIECHEISEGYKFTVTDNGIGIPEESRELVFKIFQQLHRNKGYSGSGVGLSIVKKIIENLGGKIWIESAPENGTAFHFIIPK